MTIRGRVGILVGVLLGASMAPGAGLGRPVAAPGPVAGSPVVAILAPHAHPPGPSWSGKWDTPSGGQDIVMKLAQTGDTVTGRYDLCQGTIRGTVSGDTLTGTWSQAVPRPCGGTGEPTDGTISFTMSADGSAFDGTFTYTGSSSSYPWPGGRIYPTSTKLACSPATVASGTSTSCTATVLSRARGGSSAFGTPTGSVTFRASAPGTLDPASCTLQATTAGAAACTVSFSPTAPGDVALRGAYGGDSTHGASHGRTTLTAS
jgi:hypothetical protein